MSIQGTDRLLKQLKTCADYGLSEVEAYNRLRKCGTNELERPYTRLVMVRSTALFSLAMGIVLALEGLFAYAAGATVISAGLAPVASALQARYRRDVAASGREFPVVCLGIRCGKLLRVPVYRLVPGDVVRLHKGEIVPADGSLIEAQGLVIQETMVSGDPEPVAKDAHDTGTSPMGHAECKNQVFMGTVVVQGLGTFVVTQTGAKTRICRVRALARRKRGQ